MAGPKTPKRAWDLDICSAICFCRLFAGQIAGVSTASFNPEGSQEKGTDQLASTRHGEHCDADVHICKDEGAHM